MKILLVKLRAWKWSKFITVSFCLSGFCLQKCIHTQIRERTKQNKNASRKTNGHKKNCKQREQKTTTIIIWDRNYEKKRKGTTQICQWSRTTNQFITRWLQICGNTLVQRDCISHFVTSFFFFLRTCVLWPDISMCTLNYIHESASVFVTKTLWIISILCVCAHKKWQCFIWTVVLSNSCSCCLNSQSVQA